MPSPIDALIKNAGIDDMQRQAHLRLVFAVLVGLAMLAGAVALSRVFAQVPGADMFLMVAAMAALTLLFIRLLAGVADHRLNVAAVAFEAQIGMAITDAQNRIIKVNRAFTECTGYSSEEVIGRRPNVLSSGRHDAKFYAAMWKQIERTGTWEGEIWNRRKNGEVYPEYLTISAVKDRNGTVTNYVASFADITRRKTSEEEIQNLVFYDQLTGLPNRRMLASRLKKTLALCARKNQEGALLLIDMVDLKILNSTLGHNMGDLLLQEVARRLRDCVREGDTVSRIGGDEFVVMLEDLGEYVLGAAEQAKIVSQKIFATLGHPYQLDEHEYHIGACIGAALFSGQKSSVDDLLKEADIALQQAKKSGRDSLCFFDPKMQEALNVRSALESELRLALELQQLKLYYQVQVDDMRRPLGAEALVRWEHPTRGLVSPAHFIPLAEETGLILPIGRWVLDTACAQLAAWQNDDASRDLVLAVNVSAKQFRQEGFVGQVQAALRNNGANPNLLKLELTESLLLDDIEGTVAIMGELRSIGVRFSLDDFGTGYSSLQYLKRLPLDQIKIDQSFVRGIATDLNDRAIVRTIIAMARSMGMNVIAEGVETELQQQILQDKGCIHYQGFLYSKPVPLEKFNDLLRSRFARTTRQHALELA